MRGFLYVAGLFAALAGGCGGSGTPGGSGREATLLLDSPPKALHAGIYLAVARGYDDAEGTPVRILPAEEAGAALTTGRADLAVMKLPDLVEARERGLDLVGVMAFVQDPPDLLLVVTRETLEDRDDDVGAVIRSLQRGYEEVTVDPESAVTLMIDADPGLDRATLSEQLDQVAPRFEAGVSDFGVLVREDLERSAKGIDVGRAFDGSLVARSGR